MIVAAALTMTGCATKTEYVTPDCDPPPMPAPPEVSGDELSPLDDDVYWRLRERDDALQDAIIERQQMLKELCE